MSGIFGLFWRAGGDVPGALLETMRRAMASWGPDGDAVWLSGRVGLGQARSFATPEARFEQLPSSDATRGFAFTAAGRIDNRQELIQALELSPDQRCRLADGELLRLAYGRWQAECAKRVYGDWSFAAWHPNERRVVLARDHLGCTPCYYYLDPRVFAFASKRQALLALDLVPRELDELFLAQRLVSSPTIHGERTVYKSLRRLPPAHFATVSSSQVELTKYWSLEATPIRRRPKRQDYAAAFREAFEAAVRARLRADGPIGLALSGGLDSGSVAAVAGPLLCAEGRKLEAFTSVPRGAMPGDLTTRFGDELALARATAERAGNIELTPLDSGSVTPLQAIRELLSIVQEPMHAASNLYWLVDLHRQARERGCRVLLSGQLGNGGISWTGDVRSQPLVHQLRRLGPWTWAKRRARSVLPDSLLAARRRRETSEQDWYRQSAIRPEFARRLGLFERYVDELVEQARRSPLEQRHAVLLPGRSPAGALNAELGLAYGLETRDPTADARLLELCVSVPDEVFIDPASGLDRWLIREAMRGLLPDEVRLNRRRGLQAADLVSRLRASTAEVEAALDEVDCGPATEYVDVPYMREIWSLILREHSLVAWRRAVTVLLRGLMAGLFVNGCDQ